MSVYKNVVTNHFTSEAHPICVFCGDKRLNEGDLKDHKKDQHFYCKQCFCWFRDRSRWLDHYQNLSCCLCSSSSRRYCESAVLTSHKEREHEKCPYCGSWYSDRRSYRKHRDKYHPYCDKCENYFSTEAAKRQHLIYPCNICQTRTDFCTQNDLEIHKMAVHARCSYCGQFFLTTNRLQDHLDLVHHRACPRCERCSFTETEEGGLAEHHNRYPQHNRAFSVASDDSYDSNMADTFDVWRRKRADARRSSRPYREIPRYD